MHRAVKLLGPADMFLFFIVNVYSALYLNWHVSKQSVISACILMKCCFRETDSGSGVIITS